MSKNLADTFAVGGALSQALPGYMPRPQQIRASEAIAAALGGTARIALIEAGTGVGKTMAYLIPALMHAKNERKVVISTHTLALQSQLWERDIPLAQSLHKKSVKAALMKGRGNYLCLSEMAAARGELWTAGDPDFTRITQWSKETETGDLVELPFAYSNWADIRANVDTCKGQECRYYEDCFYYRARRLAEEASIILVNHALFFADLAVRQTEPEARLLPDYDFVVFDEAHHLENAAAGAFGIAVSAGRLPALIGKVRRNTRGLDIDETRLANVEREAQALFEPFHRGGQPEFMIEEFLGDAIDTSREQVALMGVYLDGLATQLKQADTGHNPALRDRLDGLIRQILRYKEELTLIFNGADQNYLRWGSVSTARGKGPTELRASFGGALNSVKATLCWTPISVAPILREALWSGQDAGAALVSATLATGGSFDFVKRRLGIDPEDPAVKRQANSLPAINCRATGASCEGAEDHLSLTGVPEETPYGTEDSPSSPAGRGAGGEGKERGGDLTAGSTSLHEAGDRGISQLAVDSPFDYASNCLLYVARHLPSPTDNGRYQAPAIEEMVELVQASRGGAFLLFTSYRMLAEAYDAMEGASLPYPLLRQGDMPGGRLIAAFRETGNGVLFGTQSFWEGVDVPGDALRLVVIDRLPFAVPDSPLHKARVDAVTRAGGDWFGDYALPRAQLRLKQGFGRLIRTSADRGVVAILDSRLAHKSYGWRFLRSLPPARRTFEIEAVRQFYGPTLLAPSPTPGGTGRIL